MGEHDEEEHRIKPCHRITMSHATFEEFDHRLGLHDDKPNSACPVCNPAVNAAAAALWREPNQYWDYSADTMTGIPKLGDVLNLGDDGIRMFMTFASPPIPSGETFSGLWVNPVGFSPESLATSGMNFVSQMVNRQKAEVQMMMGEGTNSRVVPFGASRVIPLTNPMGVDVVAWAIEQLLANILVEMSRTGCVPVTAPAVSNHNLPDLTRSINVEVYGAKVPPPLNGEGSYQMSFDLD